MPDSVTEEFSATAADGKNYRVKHYNLDAIIVTGYRVNSKRAAAFRQWATGFLRDYTLRGYLIDRKRMENGAFLDEDYFERLLEEIREIRLSERRFYQKTTDIYSTAMDYDKNLPITKEFFAKVQNKMYFAVHGHTAAELICDRADAKNECMSLSNWANSPDGRILKSDVTIAKNYPTEAELDELGHIVNAYLDLAESRAKRRIPMTMVEAIEKHFGFISSDDVWYHGSSLNLTELAIGSTIAQWKELAEAFSHKPTSLEYDYLHGQISQKGKLNGVLYVIDETVVENVDIYKHPNSSMDEGIEWLAKRPLKLKV